MKRMISGVVVLEGNGRRESHHGDGYMESEIMYTLNTVEQHGVAYEAVDIYNLKETGETAATLNATSCESPTHSDPAVIEKTLVLNDQGGGVMNCTEDIVGTLRSQTKGHEPTIIEMTSTKNTIVEDGISPTLTARMGTGGNQVNAVQCLDVGFFDSHEEQSSTLLARQYKDPPVVCGLSDIGAYKEGVAPLRANGGDCGHGSENLAVESYQNVSDPLIESGYDKFGTQEAKNDMYITGQTVRRLTPTECERLQGFPDDWTKLPQKESMTDEEYDFWTATLFEKAVREGRTRLSEGGVWEIWQKKNDDNDDGEEVWVNTGKPYKHKTKEQTLAWYNKSFASDVDSHRYKALGNSIAVGYANNGSGFWMWLLKRISAQYERNATLGSLFDGIGGFPLAWEQYNGKGSALWASEIELFPIAVTRYHFDKEEQDAQR